MSTMNSQEISKQVNWVNLMTMKESKNNKIKTAIINLIIRTINRLSNITVVWSYQI